MGSRVIGTGMVLLVLVAMFCGGAMGQSSCTIALMSMIPCLSYVTGNSTTPSSSCCSRLASVVRTSPQCLCSVLNGGGTSFGITINQTLALSLPGACKVQTPSVNRCKAATPAPTSSASPPVSSPATPAPTASAFPPFSSPATPAPTSSAFPPVSSPATSPDPEAAVPLSSSETPVPAAVPLPSSETPVPEIAPSTSSDVPSDSGTGSKTFPSTHATSDGSIVNAPLHLLFVLFIVMCSSAFNYF